MSDQYSKTKGKKLRRRSSTSKSRGPVLSKTEALYKHLTDKGHTLDEKLKDDKYFVLLKRLSDGRVPLQIISYLMSVPEEKLVIGTIDSVFKAGTPLKSIIKVQHMSFSDTKMTSGEFIALRQQGIVLLIDGNGHVYRYQPNKLVFGELLGVSPLPADLRKWDQGWAKLFLRASLIDRASAAPSNLGEKPQNIFGGGVAKLHQIRKINQYPGKKQLITQRRTKEIYDMDAVVNPAGEVPLFSH